MRFFKGEIGNKKLLDFNVFPNVKTFEERKEHVNNELKTEFFNEYFRTYYNSKPNKAQELSEEDSVCKMLEKMGTYLLESRDIKSNRKVEYRFWKNEREYKLYKDSENLNESAITKENGSVDVIDMFVDKKKEINQKVIKGTSINKEDIKTIAEISDLQKFIDDISKTEGVKHISDVSKSNAERCSGSDKVRLHYISNNAETYTKRYKKDIKENQVAIKEIVKRPIVFKSIMKGEGVPNKLDAVNLCEASHVKPLLEFLYMDDLNTDAGLLINALNTTIESCVLTESERDIVECYRKGIPRNELPKVLDKSRKNIDNMLKRLSVKISTKYQE